MSLSFVTPQCDEKSSSSSSSSEGDIVIRVVKTASSPNLTGVEPKIYRYPSAPNVFPSVKARPSNPYSKPIPCAPAPCGPIFGANVTSDLEQFKIEILAEIDAARAGACRAVSQQCASFDITEYQAKFTEYCDGCRNDFHDQVIHKIQEEVHALVADAVHKEIENQIKCSIATHMEPAVQESIRAIQESGALTVQHIDDKVSNGQSNDMEVAQLKKQLAMSKERISKLEKQVYVTSNLLNQLAQSPIFAQAAK